MKPAMLICMVVAAGGCTMGSTTDGGMNPNADMTQGPPPDLAGDLVTPPSIALVWEVLSANIQGGNNNGFSTNCDVAGATSLTITAQNTTTQAKTTVNPMCPAGTNTGTVDPFPLPDVTGPYVVFGVLDGKPMSASQHIQAPSYPPPPLHLLIYAGGCDMPECM